MNYVTVPWFVAAIFFGLFFAAWLALDNRWGNARTDQLDDDLDRHRAAIDDRLERVEEWIKVIEPRARHLPAVELDTEEHPALPDTAPMALLAEPTPAVQARRDAAWEESQRALPAEQPHPADSDDVKTRRAAWVEAELEKIRARIDAAMEVK